MEKMSGLRVGLLINFNVVRLRTGIRRMVLLSQLDFRIPEYEKAPEQHVTTGDTGVTGTA